MTTLRKVWNKQFLNNKINITLMKLKMLSEKSVKNNR